MNLPTTKKYLELHIGGCTYIIEEYTMDTFIALEETWGCEDEYLKHLRLRSPKCLVESAHALLDANGKNFFKTWQDLAKAMPGGIVYQTMLYFKLSTLYGFPMPDISHLNMETATTEDLNEAMKTWRGSNPDLAKKVDEVMETQEKKETTQAA